MFNSVKDSVSYRLDSFFPPEGLGFLPLGRYFVPTLFIVQFVCRAVLIYLKSILFWAQYFYIFLFCAHRGKKKILVGIFRIHFPPEDLCLHNSLNTTVSENVIVFIFVSKRDFRETLIWNVLTYINRNENIVVAYCCRHDDVVVNWTDIAGNIHIVNLRNIYLS